MGLYAIDEGMRAIIQLVGILVAVVFTLYQLHHRLAETVQLKPRTKAAIRQHSRQVRFKVPRKTTNDKRALSRLADMYDNLALLLHMFPQLRSDLQQYMTLYWQEIARNPREYHAFTEFASDHFPGPDPCRAQQADTPIKEQMVALSREIKGKQAALMNKAS